MTSKLPMWYKNNQYHNHKEIHEVEIIVQRITETLTYIIDSNPELLYTKTNKGSVFVSLDNLLDNMNHFLISFSFCIYTGQLSSIKRMKDFDLPTYCGFLPKSMSGYFDIIQYLSFPEPFHKKLYPEFFYITFLYDQIYFSRETEAIAQDFYELTLQLAKLSISQSNKKTDYVIDALLYGISKYVESCLEFDEAQRLKKESVDEINYSNEEEWDIESEYYTFNPTSTVSCSHCGDSSPSKYTEDAFGHLICIDCMRDLFKKCNHCGAITHKDDTNNYEDTVICFECYEDLIFS